MLDRSRHDAFREAVAYHEAGYRVIAAAIDAPLAPTRLDRGLRRCAADVVDELQILSDPDVGAAIMLAGRNALHRHDPAANGDNDDTEAGNLVFNGLFWQFGNNWTPHALADHANLRQAELAAEAARLVDENWPEIEAEAARLLEIPRKSPPFWA
jgi:hypothetical protein